MVISGNRAAIYTRCARSQGEPKLLRAVYELDYDIPLSKVVDLQEARGFVRFAISPAASLEAVVARMNDVARELCHGSGWLQLWDGGVTIPTITFELGRLAPGIPVDLQETHGRLRVIVDEGLSLHAFAAAMNPSSATVLKGGQWFQCWQGEIVSNASSEQDADASTSI